MNGRVSVPYGGFGVAQRVRLRQFNLSVPLQAWPEEHMKLPTKLAKEPMVDAVFEMRFSSPLPVAAVLPGTLFSGLSGGGREVQITTLPNAHVPQEMRDQDPNLRYIPLVRIEVEKFAVHIGDRSLAVLCKMPYPGWSKFREYILDIVKRALDVNAIDAVERLALKYVDIFPGSDVEKSIEGFNLELKIGGHSLKKESAQIRVEIQRDGFFHGIQILTQATAEDPARGTRKTGAVLDVDSASVTRWSNMKAFSEQIPALIDEIHVSNKRIFFECLTPQLIKEMGAQYDA